MTNSNPMASMAGTFFVAVLGTFFVAVLRAVGSHILRESLLVATLVDNLPHSFHPTFFPSLAVGNLETPLQGLHTQNILNTKELGKTRRENGGGVRGVNCPHCKSLE